MFEWIKGKAKDISDWIKEKHESLYKSVSPYKFVVDKTKGLHEFFKENDSLASIFITGAAIVSAPFSAIASGAIKLVNFLHMTDNGEKGSTTEWKIDNAVEIFYDSEKNTTIKKQDDSEKNDNLNETTDTEDKENEERYSVNKNSNENLNFSSYNEILNI